MAKWGNALGGYKTQRRDSKGRFGSGKTAKTASKYGVSKRTAREINRATKRGGTVRQTTRLTDSRGRASKHGKPATITQIHHSSKSRAHEKNRKNLKRAGVQLAVGAAVVYAVHKGHKTPPPKMQVATKPVASSKMRAPSGSVAKPVAFSQAKAIVKDIERQSVEMNDFLNSWERQNRNNARGVIKPAPKPVAHLSQSTLSGIIAQELPGAKKPKRRR